LRALSLKESVIGFESLGVYAEMVALW
jgi:hypothetical protein